MKSDVSSELGGMSGSRLGASFFVLTIDIPFNVVFHAADPLTPLRGSTSPPEGATVSNARRRRSDSATTRHHRRHGDVMSRDHVPEAVRRVLDERGCRSGRSQDVSCGASGTASRYEMLSRPRSRSVCGGKYCSVSRLGLPPSERGTPAVCHPARITPRRPQSATTARHINTSTHHQLSAAATGRRRRIHVARRPSDDVTATAASAVTSSANDDVIGSRDTPPWSDKSWRGPTDSDRQSQLRRFLDASDERQQQRAPEADNDLSDDVSETEARRASVNELSQWHHGDDQPAASAMEQVRQLVNRCRLPVVNCQQPSVNELQRLDTWTRIIDHQSSVTSESLQRAILGAAAGLVRAA